MKVFFKFFLKYLFSPLILIISFSILLLTLYKSEISFQGSLRSHYVQYLILAIILIILSLITFFLSYERKKNLFIILSSIVLSIYAIEFSLYKIHNNSENSQKRDKIFQKKGLPFDNRSKLEIYLDLKKIDTNHTMVVSPSSYLKEKKDFFPLSGISNSLTIFCNENGYYSIYESDRYGFNNPDEVWNLRDIEYLIIGDSFAQGACVNRPNDLSSVFRNLSNSTVLNLGYSGNGPLREYASLREYMPLKKFSNVLWLYYSNDLNDLKFELKNDLLKKYIEDIHFKQDLYLKQNLINNIVQKKISEAAPSIKEKSFNVYNFLKFTNLRKKIQFESKKIDPNFQKIITYANDFSKQNSSKFYFIYLPSFEEIKKEKISENYIEIKNIINGLDIQFIDIYKFISEREDKMNFFPLGMHGHYNEFGYKNIAKKIYTQILKSN